MCRQDGGIVVATFATACARGSNNSRRSSNSRLTRDGDVIVLVDREHLWYEMSWLVVFAAYTAACVVKACAFYR
jgi:hypothetical protein